MSDDKFTVIFKGDICKLRVNPLTIVSPFGQVLSVWVGNAYDEVEELRAENEKLRAALKPFVEEAAGCDYYNLSDSRMWDVPAAMIRAAAAALKETGDE